MTNPKPLSAAEQMQEAAVKACLKLHAFYDDQAGEIGSDMGIAAGACGREIRSIPIPADPPDPVRAALVEALRKLSQPRSCGCMPCTGQCTSRESLLIEIDGMQDDARAALTLAGETP